MSRAFGPIAWFCELCFAPPPYTQLAIGAVTVSEIVDKPGKAPLHSIALRNPEDYKVNDMEIYLSAKIQTSREVDRFSNIKVETEMGFIYLTSHFNPGRLGPLLSFVGLGV